MYSNKHLIEVNCGFQFDEETTPWDSTYFGQYFEKIKPNGFDIKQERKGVQVVFNNPELNNDKPVVTTSNVEDQVVFFSNDKTTAITLGRNKISFHSLNFSYSNWDHFLNKIIIPYFEFYQSLNLGNGKRQCSVVYLNRFEKEQDVDLSEYFSLVGTIDKQFGKESMAFIQRIISNDKNLLIAKLDSQAFGGKQMINLECGAVCINQNCMISADWMNQANETHQPIRSFFESIITNKLKGEL